MKDTHRRGARQPRGRLASTGSWEVGTLSWRLSLPGLQSWGTITACDSLSPVKPTDPAEQPGARPFSFPGGGLSRSLPSPFPGGAGATPTHTPQAGRREAIWSQTSSSPVIAELQSSLFAGSHLTFSPVLSWGPRCATLPLLPEQTEGAHPAQQHKPKPCSVRTRAGSAAAKETAPA